MHLADSSDSDAFRREVRSWLEKNFTPAIQRALNKYAGRELKDAVHAWQSRVHAAGLAAYSWPRQYGGQGGGAIHELILAEEFAAAGLPRSAFRIGYLTGRAMMAHSSREQSAEFVPKIANGAHLWAAAFSEPGIGSDIASIQTRAIEVSGGFKIRGQKVWSTFAHIADYCFVLAKTGSEGAKSKSLSVFAVDMSLPGVSVRPIKQINGRSEFNEIFFDGVDVPAARAIGPIGDGWKVAMTFFDYERRGIADFGYYCQRAFRELVKVAAETTRPGSGSRLIDDRNVRKKIAQLGAEARVAVLNNYRFVTQGAGPGQLPGPETSLQKLHSTELYKSMHALTLELAMHGDYREARVADRIVQATEDWMTSFGWTIAGGTSQIQRNIVGERILRLPR